MNSRQLLAFSFLAFALLFACKVVAYTYNVASESRQIREQITQDLRR